MAAELATRIDADVHLEPPAIEALHPHLTAHWRDYLTENGFARPSAARMSYPHQSAVVRGAPARSSIDDLRTNVLSRSARAVLNCAYGVEGVKHPFMAAALASAVNAWVAEEFLAKDDRLHAGILVVPHDTELAVQEIARLGADRRFTHVYLAARSWEPYGNRRYWPIYEAALAHDLAVVIHFGGYTGTPATPVGSVETYFEEYTAATQLFAAHVMSLVMEGVLDRYPALRVGLLESGVTWLPTWLWKVDTEWKAQRREVPWVRRLPSSYVRERMRLTTQPLDVPAEPGDLAQVLGHLGSDDMLMYASDYPHQHASDPDTLLGLLGPAARERFLRTNAWTFYGLASRVPSGAR